MSNINEIKSVSVLGAVFEIEYVDVVDKTDPSFGTVDFFNSKIYIDKNLTDNMKRVTLMHEVMHCIFWATGLYELGEDESIIQRLSMAMCSVLEDNKEALVGGTE